MNNDYLDILLAFTKEFFPDHKEEIELNQLLEFIEHWKNDKK